MLARFCLYGFIKNQKYFEPFLYLAFLEKGLSFTHIGFLIGFREICINLLEVPTGALADVLGRRRAMIFSHLAYIGAFAIFGLYRTLGLLFAGMFLFSLGEAFRTGTHKAIIFDWLAREGRADQKTQTYGLTRSWSKLGSALSAIIAAALVFLTGGFSKIFLFSIIPYAVNLVNFLTYPGYLDGPRQGRSVRDIARTLTGALASAVRNPPLRRLLVESMGFQGLYRSCKDYLQPVLKAAAISLPILAWCGRTRRAAILVGAVYFAISLLSSFASRHAGSLSRRVGGEARASRRLWATGLAVFAALAIGIVTRLPGVAIAAFVAFEIVQNFWRPILISRVAQWAQPSQMATVLSVESQARSLFAAVAAPLLGLAVDLMPAGVRFLPVAALGVALTAAMLATGRKSKEQGPTSEPQ